MIEAANELFFSENSGMFSLFLLCNAFLIQHVTCTISQ